jgi:Protein of unknown function (DUF3311)
VNTRSTPATGRSARGWWYLLLLLPFIAMLWVPSYASGQPELFGFPFFYWYQFLWILISAILTAVVYFVTREPEGAEPNAEALSMEE